MSRILVLILIIFYFLFFVWRWRLITPETALLISALRAFLIFFRWSPSFLRLTSWNMRRTLSSEGHKNTRTNLNALGSYTFFLFFGFLFSRSGLLFLGRPLGFYSCFGKALKHLGFRFVRATANCYKWMS